MKRNVVVARHDDLRLRQRVEKRTRLLELVRTRPLCKVARDCDEIRFNLSHGADQRINQRRIDASEVQVREMNYRSHYAPSLGTSTRNARSRTRYRSGGSNTSVSPSKATRSRFWRVCIFT